MAKLTKRAINSFHYNGGWDVRWDDEVPGFGVRIYPSGKKAFVLSYRIEGRKRLMRLGRYGADLTVDQARDRARRLRVKIRDGADPLEERNRAAKGETFGDLCRRYIEEYAKARKKTWRDDEMRLRRNIPANWKGRKARNISHQDVVSLHSAIGTAKPYEANRLGACLHKMFRLARSWGMIEKDAVNPAAGIEKFKERKRKRWAKPEEVRALAWAIDQEPNIYVRAGLWLYLLTALRKSELLNAQRADIDWQRAQIRLPNPKAGEEQIAALSAPALAILRATPVLGDNPYILPGSKRGRALVNINKPWRRVRERATVRLWNDDAEPRVSGLVHRLTERLGRVPSLEECQKAANFDLPTGLLDLRLHDLRRSVGSWMSQDKVDLNTIREALRHSSISTTLTYARLGADPARAAMEAHGRRVMEVAGKPRLVESAGDKE